MWPHKTQKADGALYKWVQRHQMEPHLTTLHPGQAGVTNTLATRLQQATRTWGELCELGQLEPGCTDPATPVERVLTTGGVLKGGASKTPSMPPCGMGGCGSGACQFQ